jgi:phage repressor protein C with HTH and peptisase S24 domain
MDAYQIRLLNARMLAEAAGGPAAFARKLNKSTGQVAHIIGPQPVKNIGPQIAREIEAAFCLPHGWIDQLHGKTQAAEGQNALRVAEQSPPPYAAYSGHDEFVEVPVLGTVDHGAAAEVEIPFYTSVSAAAGDGSHNAEGAPQPVKLRFRAESLRRKGIDPASARVVYVRGDSMEPLMSDGDQIMFDTSRTAIRDGELYVIRVDADEMVKRLHKRPGDRVVVQSENPAFAPYKVSLADPAFAVLGQVVWRAGWM